MYRVWSLPRLFVRARLSRCLSEPVYQRSHTTQPHPLSKHMHLAHVASLTPSCRISLFCSTASNSIQCFTFPHTRVHTEYEQRRPHRPSVPGAERKRPRGQAQASTGPRRPSNSIAFSNLLPTRVHAKYKTPPRLHTPQDQLGDCFHRDRVSICWCRCCDYVQPLHPVSHFWSRSNCRHRALPSTAGHTDAPTTSMNGPPSHHASASALWHYTYRLTARSTRSPSPCAYSLPCWPWGGSLQDHMMEHREGGFIWPNCQHTTLPSIAGHTDAGPQRAWTAHRHTTQAQARARCGTALTTRHRLRVRTLLAVALKKPSGSHDGAL
mmetsp:Transcript_4750/g.8147  ORF Transcript_4750/g.8147 Transcript_4750/m.8147 type:complete len:323 (-) Transcript_4750:835-1803(-)